MSCPTLDTSLRDGKACPQVPRLFLVRAIRSILLTGREHNDKLLICSSTCRFGVRAECWLSRTLLLSNRVSACAKLEEGPLPHLLCSIFLLTMSNRNMHSRQSKGARVRLRLAVTRDSHKNDTFSYVIANTHKSSTAGDMRLLHCH